ncbi:hypothetical protein GCM10010371_63670 [Streptomyces subrutilus]|uniref:Histidine kinase/HSP90-like ATPase domain-containing protein n=2 Tax=Streptomyces subrutilus TaxID=36818 RepID=A0A918RDS2_9ACTN|nr:hypothetical protein GCM10010371_63670 [Streptomyces subrutilus]
MDLELELTEHSISSARRLLREGVRMWGLEAMADDLGLVVAELLTNVLRHAVQPNGDPVGRCRCVVQRVPNGLVAVVHDDDPTLPRERTAGEDDLAGRGLRIVRELATTMAVAPSPPAPGGKDITVVFLHPPTSDRPTEAAA